MFILFAVDPDSSDLASAGGAKNKLYITYTDFTWQIRRNNTFYEALKMHFSSP